VDKKVEDYSMIAEIYKTCQETLFLVLEEKKKEEMEKLNQQYTEIL
jgi:hypothetical protein